MHIRRAPLSNTHNKEPKVITLATELIHQSKKHSETSKFTTQRSLNLCKDSICLLTLDCMVYGMSVELRTRGVAVLAPGFVRTERVMAVHAVQNFPLYRTESSEHIGRAVAHLAADAGIMQKTGKVLAVGDLAREYGFTDIGGKQPPDLSQIG